MTPPLCFNNDSPLLRLILEGVEPFDGAVVLAALSHSKEGMQAKLRAVVLRSFDGARWHGWETTQQPHAYGGRGPSRVRLPAEPCGLPGPTYCRTLERLTTALQPDCIVGVVWAGSRELLTRLAGEDQAQQAWAHGVSDDIEAAGWYWPREES